VKVVAVAMTVVVLLLVAEQSFVVFVGVQVVVVVDDGVEMTADGLLVVAEQCAVVWV